MMKTRAFCLGIFALAALGSTGCASARVCRGITSRADEVKFLYYEGGETGVIKCKAAGDGSLSDCHPMTVTLED